MRDSLTNFDWAIILAYLVGVVGLGVAAGFLRRRGGEGSHYFLAGNTLTWPIIGLAMFAANISTVHLVSLAEAAYKYGLVFGNFEWMAGFTLILLSLFFAPLYLRSRVPTLPDYLERRFNRRCRDYLAFVSLFSAIVIHIGVALYTAAWVLCGILNLDPHATILGLDALMFFIIALGVLTGIYTMLGGLLAVVWTESIQTVLLLVGAVCITVVGYVKIGGWSALAQTLGTHPHPMAGAEGFPATTANFLNMARGAERSQRAALVFDPARLPGAGHLVLVLRPDHRPARAGGARRKAGPAGAAVLRLPQDPAGVLLRAARRHLRRAGPAGHVQWRRPGEGRRHLHLHAGAAAAGGFERTGRRRHAGRRHADLLRGAELGGDALCLRHRPALAARHQRPPTGGHRQSHHGRRHGRRHRHVAPVRPLRHHLCRHQQAHLLRRPAHHGGVPVRRVLEEGLGPRGVHYAAGGGGDGRGHLPAGLLEAGHCGLAGAEQPGAGGRLRRLLPPRDQRFHANRVLPAGDLLRHHVDARPSSCPNRSSPRRKRWSGKTGANPCAARRMATAWATIACWPAACLRPLSCST